MTDQRLPTPTESGLDRLALLHDPVRRRVFAHVSNAGVATRDETATAVGIDRPLAAFHLERLLEAGLVNADAAVAASASAGGTMGKRPRGRPAKRYRPSNLDLDVSLPSRDYRLAAELFADALAATERPKELDTVAFERGRKMGRVARSKARAPRPVGQRRPSSSQGPALPPEVLRVLVDEGYAPRTTPSGAVCLANCPFDSLAKRQRDVICPTNLVLLGGVLDGAGVETFTPRLNPEPGGCCVLIEPVTTSD